MGRDGRGRVAASRGDLAGAAALCREAVALAETTDDLNMHGDVLLDLAHVLAAAGDAGSAGAAAAQARALFEAKGNVVQAAAAGGKR